MAVNELIDKRLLMTADTVGGVWTYALELAQGIQPYGIQVHLATMGRLPSVSQQQQAAKIPNLQLHQSSYQLEWMDNPWSEVNAAGEWLQRLEEQLSPHLVHLNNYCHGQLGWSAPVLMVGHSCVLSWWQAVKGEAAPPSYATYARRLKEGLQAADLIIAPTEAFLQQLNHYYGPFTRCCVIPNGRDSRSFAPAAKEDRILSVGRLWDDAKNVGVCDIAARRLSWPLEIAGDTEHPGSARHNTYQHLKLLGQLAPEAVADKMAKAAIYVMPARYEPFGLSILEAALSGCALVLGDIPSLRENWQGAALFVDPDNPEDIHDKLAFMIRHPKLRERMGALARQRATAFSLRAQAAAYVQQYRQLIGNQKQPAKTKPVRTKRSTV